MAPTPPGHLFIVVAVSLPEGTVRAVAMPNLRSNGTYLKPSNLVYAWEREFNAISSASGAGKNAYTFTNNVLRDNEYVSVRVSSLDQSAAAQNTRTIPVHQPTTVLYENDPLVGIDFNNELDAFTFLTGNNFDVFAQPFFFSGTSNTDSNIDYTWRINNDSVTVPFPKNRLFLEFTRETQGRVTISLEVENNDTFLQTHLKTMTLTI